MFLHLFRSIPPLTYLTPTQMHPSLSTTAFYPRLMLELIWGCLQPGKPRIKCHQETPRTFSDWLTLPTSNTCQGPEPEGSAPGPLGHAGVWLCWQNGFIMALMSSIFFFLNHCTGIRITTICFLNWSLKVHIDQTGINVSWGLFPHMHQASACCLHWTRSFF